MQAVILCPTLPEIENRPVVQLQLAWFSGHGVKEVAFIGKDTTRLGDGSEWGMRFQHAASPEAAIPALQPTFFLMKASTYVPVDCEDSWREFRITPQPVLNLVLANDAGEPRFLVLRKDVFKKALSMDLRDYLAAAESVGTYKLTERAFEVDSEAGRAELTRHIRSSP